MHSDLPPLDFLSYDVLNCFKKNCGVVPVIVFLELQWKKRVSIQKTNRNLSDTIHERISQVKRCSCGSPSSVYGSGAWIKCL